MTTTTTIAPTFRQQITCPGVGQAPASYASTPDALNAGWLRYQMACACGYTQSMLAADGYTPTIGWHVRPDAPLHLLLRAAAEAGQHGHSCTPAGYYLPRDFGSPGHVYWTRQTLRSVADGMTDDTVARIARLSARYQAFHRYATEVAPRWEVVETWHFADNSTEVVERAHDGRTRRRMTVAPGGDACF